MNGPWETIGSPVGLLTYKAKVQHGTLMPELTTTGTISKTQESDNLISFYNSFVVTFVTFFTTICITLLILVFMNTEAKIKTEVKPPVSRSTKQARGKSAFVKDGSARSEANGIQPAQLFSYNSVDDNNVLAIIHLVRSGISYKDFNKIADDTPFSLTEWASYLQLSERTIQRNQKEKKSFQPIQSERIVELSMLYQYGVEVFGDKDNFNTWLNAKSIALGGRTPKELLDTKFGISMVRDELGRIEQGILA